MKRQRFGLAAFLVFSFAAVASSSKAAEPIKLTEFKITPATFEVDSCEVRDGRVNVTLRVKSTSPTVLTYRAYDPHSPLYSEEIEQANVWVHRGGVWCGTGVNEYQVGPGESFTFQVSEEVVREFRVGLYLTDMANLEAGTVWSPAIRRCR